MKTNFILIFLFLTGGIFSQQTPEFSFEFWIEDALGNKDTVTIGYDELATDGIDSNFGEIDIINQTWNSDLEARVGDKIYTGLGILSSDWIRPNNSYLSKKQILKSYCEESDYSERVSIQFTAENYPITISWNDKLFEENCHKYSFIFGQDDHYHFDVTGFVMLRSTNSWVIDSTLIFEGRTLASYESNGKTIGVLQFVFHRNYTLDVAANKLNDIKVYPNPVINDFINVEFEGQFVLLDITGKIIQQGKVLNNKIGFEVLDKGIYNLILTNGSATHQSKIIKL